MRQPSKRYDPKFMKAVLRKDDAVSSEKLMKKINKIAKNYFGKKGETKYGESGRAVFFFVSDLNKGNIDSFINKMERLSDKTGFFYKVFIKN